MRVMTALDMETVRLPCKGCYDSCCAFGCGSAYTTSAERPTMREGQGGSYGWSYHIGSSSDGISLSSAKRMASASVSEPTAAIYMGRHLLVQSCFPATDCSSHIDSRIIVHGVDHLHNQAPGHRCLAAVDGYILVHTQPPHNLS
jgi:hypothetical protein